MAFPANPTDGQVYKNKIWRASTSAWVDQNGIVDSGSNFTKFADGAMEAWGTRTASATLTHDTGGTFPNHSNTGTVTFPTAFHSSSVVVTATVQRQSDGSYGAFVSIHDITATGFKWRQTAAHSQTSVTIHWHARGRHRA
jgi:hypothetical protein